MSEWKERFRPLLHFAVHSDQLFVVYCTVWFYWICETCLQRQLHLSTPRRHPTTASYFDKTFHVPHFLCVFIGKYAPIFGNAGIYTMTFFVDTFGIWRSLVELPSLVFRSTVNNVAHFKQFCIMWGFDDSFNLEHVICER